MSGTRQQPKITPQAAFAFPEAQGLFDPKREFDACGVGFIADLKARGPHQLVADALAILENLEHRGAVGADPTSGDGAGILIQIPHEFLKEQCAASRSSCRSLDSTPAATSSCRRTAAESTL